MALIEAWHFCIGKHNWKQPRINIQSTIVIVALRFCAAWFNLLVNKDNAYKIATLQSSSPVHWSSPVVQSTGPVQ